MATLQERFDAINGKLDEATSEILAEIQTLKDESLSPEGEASLERMESKVTELADIAPPIETPAG